MVKKTEKTIRVLVAESQPLLRLGIRHMLEGTEVSIVGEVDSAQALAAAAQELEPDLILIEPRLGNQDGLQAVGHVKLFQPDMPILVLSFSDNPSTAARALTLGASGFLTKACTRDELLEAIRVTSSGQSLWVPNDTRRLSGTLGVHNSKRNDDVLLTAREMDVLRYVTQGMTNKEIGKELSISYETVKEHVQHIIRKIGVWDRTQAAVWAVRSGIY